MLTTLHTHAAPTQQPEELSEAKTVVLKGMQEVSSPFDVLATLHIHAAPSRQPEELSGVKTVDLKGMREVSPAVMRCDFTAAWLDAASVTPYLRMPP